MYNFIIKVQKVAILGCGIHYSCNNMVFHKAVQYYFYGKYFFLFKNKHATILATLFFCLGLLKLKQWLLYPATHLHLLPFSDSNFISYNFSFYLLKH